MLLLHFQAQYSHSICLFLIFFNPEPSGSGALVPVNMTPGIFRTVFPKLTDFSRSISPSIDHLLPTVRIRPPQGFGIFHPHGLAVGKSGNSQLLTDFPGCRKQRQIIINFQLLHFSIYALSEPMAYHIRELLFDICRRHIPSAFQPCGRPGHLHKSNGRSWAGSPFQIRIFTGSRDRSFRTAFIRF